MSEKDEGGSDSSCLVGLYLYGDDLLPEDVSKLFDIPATKARPKGYVRKLSSGAEVTQPTGFWEVSAKVDVERIDDHISELIGRIRTSGSLIGAAGITDGHLDIYFATDESVPLKFNIVLTAETVRRLAELGLGLQLSAR